MKTSRSKSVAAMAIASVALILATSVADARVGRGSSFGSRGARTYSPPPVTRTAPAPAQTMQRSTTPQTAQPGTSARNPGTQAARPGGFFNRPGFMGGMFAGLLGAGLLGMLFGSGFFGGLAGFGSFLGLALQLLIVFFLVRWAMRAFARRQQPAMAGGPSGGSGPGTGPLRRVDLGGPATRAGGLGSLGRLGSGSARAANPDELGITQQDLDTFERMLTEVQTAYGKEDIAALRGLTTPEMLSYLVEDLTDNASHGITNRISDVKLRSGDVAESWREGDAEYATAAMKYSLTDETLDRGSGRVVETGPGEATELWTFRRARGQPWMVSAIQQAA